MSPTENHKITADFSQIELHKENIQPIRSGRSVIQLNSLFNSNFSSSSGQGLTLEDSQNCDRNTFNPVLLNESLKKGHEYFQSQIKLLELMGSGNHNQIKDPKGKESVEQFLGDPLELYAQYVRWTVESYPSGGSSAESRLLPLLETSTRKFFRSSRYRNDLRYLKLWILYSQQVFRKSSQTMFAFLVHNQIGVGFSLLYQEYVAVLDDQNKMEQVLRLGISQKELVPGKDALVRLLDELLRSKAPIAPQPSIAKPIRPPSNSSKFKVFEDGVDGQDVPGSILKWEDIGTVNHNRKQNTIDPTAWKGQKLPMKTLANSSVMPAKHKMTIFEDHLTLHDRDEPLAGIKIEEVAPRTHLNQESPPTPRPIMDEYELLKLDPFRYYSALEHLEQ